MTTVVYESGFDSDTVGPVVRRLGEVREPSMAVQSTPTATQTNHDPTS